jgi:hypothetical protein
VPSIATESFLFPFHSPLHVSAPTGHPQVEHTLVIFPGAINTTTDYSILQYICILPTAHQEIDIDDCSSYYQNLNITVAQIQLFWHCILVTPVIITVCYEHKQLWNYETYAGVAITLNNP